MNAAGTPNPGTGAVTADDSTTFVNESISGGAVTAYNSAGTPVNVQLRWALTSTTGGADTWNLFYQSNPSATGTTPEWTNVGTNFTFSSSGALTSPTNGSISIPNLTVGGQSLGTVSVNFGSSGLDAIRQHGRHRDHQQPDAERIRRRPVAVAGDQQ